MQRVSVLVAAIALVGCEAMPVTVAPYAGYGGAADGFRRGGGDSPNSRQAGVSCAFVLGARGAVANAVPSPSLPAQIRVNNSTSVNQSQGQGQGQSQSQQSPPYGHHHDD